jgi:hypothetical protein
VNAARLSTFVGGKLPTSYVTTVIESEETEVKLPEEFELLKDLENPIRESVCSYLASRGLNKKLLDMMQVGYCRSGRSWGYIIFPVFNAEGEVVWWQGRRYKKREPKFYNPKASYKSELVYCVGVARRPKKIILVESIINALTIGSFEHSKRLVFAIFGKSLSDAQLHRILVYEKCLEGVVVALDRDAWPESVKIADRLAGILPIVKIAKFPPDVDINDVGRQAAWDIIEQAQPYFKDSRMQILLQDPHPWERKTYEPTVY